MGEPLDFDKAIDRRSPEEKMSDLLQGIPGPVAKYGDIIMDSYGAMYVFDDSGWVKIGDQEEHDDNPDIKKQPPEIGG